MGFFKRNRRIKVKLCVIGLFLAIFITFIILRVNPDICEFWTLNFTQGYVMAVGSVNKYIPFSMSELVVFVLFSFGLTFLVMSIILLFKKRFIKSLNSFLNLGMIVFFVLAVYQTTAGMAYNRKPVNVPLYNQKVEKTEFKKIISWFIDDLNYCCEQLEFTSEGNLVEPYGISKLDEVIEKEYLSYPEGYLFPWTTKTKPMISSFVYLEFHITGITCLPLGEANVNGMIVNAAKPYTICHELAHTKGAMREADADLVSAYLCLNSSDPYVRYSGYYYTIGSAMEILKYTDNNGDYNEIYYKLHPDFRKNLAWNSAYWKAHNKWAEFANWINDIYLKIMGTKDGTKDYGDSATIVNPGTKEITSFSSFQKVYFEKYYRINSEE